MHVTNKLHGFQKKNSSNFGLNTSYGSEQLKKTPCFALKLFKPLGHHNPPFGGHFYFCVSC